MEEVLTDNELPYFDKHQRAPASRPAHLFSLIGLVPSHLHLRKMLKTRALKYIFPELAPQLSAIKVKVMGMLLPTVLAHLRLP